MLLMMKMVVVVFVMMMFVAFEEFFLGRFVVKHPTKYAVSIITITIIMFTSSSSSSYNESNRYKGTLLGLSGPCQTIVKDIIPIIVIISWSSSSTCECFKTLPHPPSHSLNSEASAATAPISEENKIQTEIKSETREK